MKANKDFLLLNNKEGVPVMKIGETMIKSSNCEKATWNQNRRETYF